MGRSLTRCNWLGMSRQVIESRRDLATCDAVISTGGPFLNDHTWLKIGSVELPSVGYLSYLADLAVAQQLGIPTILFGHSLGPILFRVNRSAIRRVLQRCLCVRLRDTRSVRTCEEVLGLTLRRLNASPDLAFMLNCRRETLSGVQRCHRVAINVRRLTGRIAPLYAGRASSGYDVEMSYLTLVQRLVRALRDEDAKLEFHFVSHVDDDCTRAAELCVKGLDGCHCVIHKRFKSIVEHVEFLASCEFMICTRYHSVVYAMLAGVPFVVMPYAIKVQQALEDYGWEEASLGSCGVNRTVEYGVRYYRERSDVRGRLFDRTEDTIHKAWEGYGSDLSLLQVGRASGSCEDAAGLR